MSDPWAYRRQTRRLRDTFEQIFAYLCKSREDDARDLALETAEALNKELEEMDTQRIKKMQRRIETGETVKERRKINWDLIDRRLHTPFPSPGINKKKP